jgi:hydroxymethylpyrimidine pyrophosphatase-like HAD family hydrolase
MSESAPDEDMAAVQGAGVPTTRTGAMLDLRLDVAALSTRLSERLEAAGSFEENERFGVFLLAGALSQVFEDSVHGEAFTRQRAERLSSSAHPVVRLSARVAGAAAVGVSEAKRLTPRGISTSRTAPAISRLVERLAQAVVQPDDLLALDDSRHLWEHLRLSVEGSSQSLLRTVLRIPDPFYRFDQSLDDCRALVRKFSERWPDRQRKIAVTGIRTSGSYLAPLYQALLLDCGYESVGLMTVRPHQHWRRREVASVRSAAPEGLFLIIDDPPATGRAVAGLAQDLERLGVPRSAIVPVIPLLGPASMLPEPIRRYESVLLPWHEWSIHAQLAPESVEQALGRMLVGRTVATSLHGALRVAAVREVDRIQEGRTDEAADGRRHVTARYRAVLVGNSGVEAEQQVVVTALGPAYFSERAADIASRLSRYIDAPLGIERGLLYERFLEADSRVALPPSPTLEESFVSYVVARRELLEVDEDPAPRVMDDHMVWRMAADALGKAIAGPFRALVYPVTHRAALRLLSVTRPSITDGNLALAEWSLSPVRADHLLKRNWIGRLTCYDPVCDLATAAASVEVEELANGDDSREGFGDRLVKAYARRTGEMIDAERWLLYQLVENHQRLEYLARRFALERGPEGRGAGSDDDRVAMRHWLATRRALARAYQRYLSGIFFADLDQPAEGPLCALDVDWVLETRWLEFPALTPAAALSLRALVRHGYRPLLVTARSLGEVRERCQLYRLAGGVAEFGSVLYDHQSGRVIHNLRPGDRDALARLRDELEKLSGVYVDWSHEHSVRAFRLMASGSVRGLDENSIGRALDAAGVRTSVRVLRGGGQTDFVAVDVDKGMGLRALAAALGAPGDERPIAFAIGDDWPDAPMLELARARFAPANLSDALRGAIPQLPGLQVTRDPYGSGVLQAVTTFLGHPPRACSVCRPPGLSDRQNLLLAALAGLDGTRWKHIRQAASLGAVLARSSRLATQTFPRANR